MLCDKHFQHDVTFCQLLFRAGGPQVMQGTMALKDILKTHRTWEDGVSLVLGLMIGLSPWFYDEPAVPAVLFSVVAGIVGTNELSRVLIALNAMIPDTATTCNSNTMSNARDSFMFGSGMSPKSIPADAAEARRAVAAASFLCLKSRRIFICLFEATPARAREIGRLDRRSF